MLKVTSSTIELYVKIYTFLQTLYKEKEIDR